MAVTGDPKKRGPYIVRIPYTITGLTHELTFQCAVSGTVEPGVPPTDVNLITRNGVGRTLSNAVLDFWSIARLILPVGAITSQYYLERAQAGTDKLFYTSSGTLGTATGGAAISLTRQLTLTFRSANSGVARLIFLEGTYTGENVQPLVPDEASTAAPERLAAWVIDGDSPVLATDASWLVAPMSIADTQNEAIYNSRYRK